MGWEFQKLDTALMREQQFISNQIIVPVGVEPKDCDVPVPVALLKCCELVTERVNN